MHYNQGRKVSFTVSFENDVLCFSLERDVSPDVPRSPLSPLSPSRPSLPGSPLWPGSPGIPGYPHPLVQVASCATHRAASRRRKRVTHSLPCKTLRDALIALISKALPD